MTDQQDQGQFARLRVVFLEATNLPPEQRAAYLDTACGDDEDLRAQLEKLLRRDDPESTVAELRGRVGRAIRPFGGEPPEPDIGPHLRGYQIVRELHRGGQGIVYQAVQKSTKRKVAVKVMKEGPFAGSADKARFEREVQVLGQLKHPNIVTIHDSGAAAGHFYFVMDYISGQALDAYMFSDERSIGDTLKLFGKICDAVNAAHLKG